MPCLHAFSRYRSVESATCTKRLPATHAVHADTARLASLQNSVITLRTFDLFNKRSVAPSLVYWDMLAFSCGVPTLWAEGLAVLSCLSNLP
jgi:hypothetical protein